MKRLVVVAALLLSWSCSAPEDAVEEHTSRLVTPAFVQRNYTTPQSSQSSVAVSFTAPVVAGRLIVVFVGWSSDTLTVSSISDNRGNTYQLAAGPTRSTGNATQYVYYAANVAAGSTTVTAQMSGAAPFVDLRIVEYSGVDPTNPLDVAAAAAGSSATANSGAFTAAAGDLVVASNYVFWSTFGPGAGYTQRVITVPNSDIVEDRVVPTAGSYTATASVTNGWWIMSAAAFRGAPDGGGGTGGSMGAGGAGGSAGGTSGTGGGAAGTGGGGTGGAAGTGGGAGDAGTGGVAGAGGDGGMSGAGGSAGVSGSSGTSGTTGTGGTGGAPVPPAFPVVYSADHRHLRDQNDAPFPILGRTAWGIITIAASSARNFLDDTAAKGFNVVEMGAIWHHPTTTAAPFAGNGALPFLKRLDGNNWTGSLSYGTASQEAPDLTTPNPTYWSFVDGFLNDALSRGLLVMMFPAYVGFGGGPDGWMVEMAANGPDKVMTYGMFLANRYKAQTNVVWMAGGDYGTGSHPFTGPHQTVEHALLAGMRSVPGQQSVMSSAEWHTESVATDQTPFGAAMTLNGTYSFTGDVVTQGRRAYGFAPAIPSFLLEEPYDEEGPDGNNINTNATQPVRRFEWWGWLSTIGGYVAGNGFVWPFNSPWTTHLNTQGAQDLARLNAFVRSIPWWQLVPSGLGGMQTLCTAGCGSGAGVVTAAATPTGSLLVAYVPPAHSGSVTIAMTALAGSTLARWYNPATAAYTTIGTFPNTGTQVFNPPADNGSGFDDWVLVLGN